MKKSKYLNPEKLIEIHKDLKSIKDFRNELYAKYENTRQYSTKERDIWNKVERIERMERLKEKYKKPTGEVLKSNA